ncbi:olfactory receptor 1496-like [Pelobates fuscus]|uniref:olfactory receptor 1496-like n=1 Tax=Pelobates fuscus TaxID=191477 RepID=UPI002FE4538B
MFGELRMENNTKFTEFILIGFPGLPQKFHPLVSVTMFLIYIIAMTANGTVIFLIIVKEHLHQPMYLMIFNLSLSDLIFDTITLPKIIAMYWFGDGKMSFMACIVQTFCVHFLANLNSFTIMLMAVDRYVAIWNPLRYSSIITNTLIACLCCILWLIAACFPMSPLLKAAQVLYCGNKVKSCFCSISSVLPLSCVDTFFITELAFTIAMITLLIPLAFIIFSYIAIIRTVCLSGRNGDWQKAFYTCSIHLFVICMYFIPRLFVYTCNQLRLILNADINVLLLCLYTFVPHVANPIIYCLRNKEIKTTIEKIFCLNKNMGHLKI